MRPRLFDFAVVLQHESERVMGTRIVRFALEDFTKKPADSRQSLRQLLGRSVIVQDCYCQIKFARRPIGPAPHDLLEDLLGLWIATSIVKLLHVTYALVVQFPQL